MWVDLDTVDGVDQVVMTFAATIKGKAIVRDPRVSLVAPEMVVCVTPTSIVAKQAIAD